MRAILDRLYGLSSALAALCLCLIALLVLMQVFGRLIDGALHAFGQPIVGLTVPSLNEFAGFLFVAATFLALASTLRRADHIRVSMLIKAVPLRVRRWLEALVLLAGAGLAGYASWHAVLLVVDSIQFNSVSFGVIPVPLAIPQAALATGHVVITIALADELWRVVTSGVPTYQAFEDEKADSLNRPTLQADDPLEGRL